MKDEGSSNFKLHKIVKDGQVISTIKAASLIPFVWANYSRVATIQGVNSQLTLG